MKAFTKRKLILATFGLVLIALFFVADRSLKRHSKIREENFLSYSCFLADPAFEFSTFPEFVSFFGISEVELYNKFYPILLPHPQIILNPNGQIRLSESHRFPVSMLSWDRLCIDSSGTVYWSISGRVVPPKSMGLE